MSDTTPARAVSPGARDLAQRHRIDLNAVTGSGPGGRVLRVDVEALVTPGAPAQAGEVDELRGAVRRVELNRTQRVVARRMAQAAASAPTFTVETEIEMDACLEERAARRAAGQPPSLNDMVVKAVALALRATPRANGAYLDGTWELYERVNVGIAVAALDTLVVPTIFDADRKTLDEIADASRSLAVRVRAGRITPADLGGGTFTVSNLGMMGVTRFTAAINPPQAAILAVGGAQARTVEGETRQVMSVTLTCDHRILYGADAAAFLGHVKHHLERPETL